MRTAQIDIVQTPFCPSKAFFEKLSLGSPKKERMYQIFAEFYNDG